MTATPLPAAPAPEAPPAAATGAWTRWSDRLNPILVREVQQAVKGRVFAITVFGALVVTVAIAATVANRYQPGTAAGRGAFHAGLATLMPLLLFIVPMQAYQSMRLEMRSGIVEQLLLSRLRPFRILLGKLQAALVQFVVYVAVMSPLLATSYLLRGVDVPTIVLSLVLAALACLLATMFAISSAAQSALPGLQGIANLATAFGLGMAAFGGVGFVGSGACTEVLGWILRGGSFWAAFSGILLATLLGCTLSMLAAQSFLLHAFENKATGFRVFLLALPACGFGWLLLSLDPTFWPEFVPAMTYGLLLVGIVFGVFMVTEQRELSPRLRAHAPRGRLTGLLAAPFLPGRDRGTACFLLYLGVLALVAWLGWPSGGRFDFRSEAARLFTMTAGYALLYFAFGRWLRGRLPPTVAGNHLGRFLLPVAMFLLMLVPLLIDAFVRRDVGQWHVGHALNPFWTIAEFAFDQERWGRIADAVWLVLAGGVLLQLPALWRGAREVLAAGAARAAAAPRTDGGG